jgi:hypothetical protein
MACKSMSQRVSKNTKMKSIARGKRTLPAEVAHVSAHGLWVLVGVREYFLDYENYPWFAQGTIAEVTCVELLRGHHLRWPDLDVDLELESLEYPEKYPLVYR